MDAKIRLDQYGSPYLVISYSEDVGDELSAADDAERLFFQRLNSNGGSIHLVPGKEKTSRVLVVPGYSKLSASLAASSLNGTATPAPANTTEEPLKVTPVKVSTDEPVRQSTTVDPPPSLL